MVEGAALEMLYRGNSIVGSNPTLSAIFLSFFGCFQGIGWIIWFYFVLILYVKSYDSIYGGRGGIIGLGRRGAWSGTKGAKCTKAKTGSVKRMQEGTSSRARPGRWKQVPSNWHYVLTE